MVISSKEFQPVLADVMKFIADGKIQNQLANSFKSNKIKLLMSWV